MKKSNTKKLYYKVVTSELKSLGLRKNPTIFTYKLNEWKHEPKPTNDVGGGEKTYTGCGIFEERVLSGNISHIEITIDNRCNLEHTIETDILYYIENKDQKGEYVTYDSFYQESLYDTFEDAQNNVKKLYAGYTP